MLLFSDLPAEERLINFEAATKWYEFTILPIVIGIILALIAPWITYAGSWLAEVPTQKTREIQSRSRHQIKIDQLQYEIQLDELKAEREMAAIEAGKRKAEIERIEDDDIREEVSKEVDAIRQPTDDSNSQNLKAGEIRIKRIIEKRQDEVARLKGELLRSETAFPGSDYTDLKNELSVAQKHLDEAKDELSELQVRALKS